MASTPKTSLFYLSRGTLDYSTSTSGGADRANADEDTEPAADASAAGKTVPDDDIEPGEPKAEDDDKVEFTRLVKAVDRRWMRPPQAIVVRAIKDLSTFVEKKQRR